MSRPMYTWGLNVEFHHRARANSRYGTTTQSGRLTCNTSPPSRQCVHIHIYIYIHMYVYRYVCMYVCMCLCVCMYICMYVCMYVLVKEWRSRALARHPRERAKAHACPRARDLFSSGKGSAEATRAPMSAPWGARAPPVEPDRRRWERRRGASDI